MFENILAERGIMKIWETDTPWDKRREEIKDLLCREEYGFAPEKAENVTFEFETPEDWRESFCANKVRFLKMICKGEVCGREFSFPFKVVLPKKGKKVPYFIHLNFRPDLPDKIQPTEEITDKGFAIISVCYNDITKDNDDFTDGVAGAIFGGKERKPDDCGKLMIWAWAMSLLRDYAETMACFDHERGALIGHSRLGKAVLLAGMIDERFKILIATGSGCSGAALSKGKEGEKIARICTNYSYWFCENYKKYADAEETLPFDQHFLLASIAPRRVYVAGAEEDLWADPKSEFLSCVAASEVYEKLGLKGFVCDEKLPEAEAVYQNGEIAYHLRRGIHYLSRKDWNLFMDYLKNL